MSFDQDKRRKTFRLRFDEDFPGLVVHFRKPGYRALRELAAAVLVLGDDLSGPDLSGDAVLEAWDPLFSAMARSVRQWNLTDSGRAVPLSQLLDQDWEFLIVLARSWYREVVQHQEEPRPQGVDRPGDNSPARQTDAPPLPPTIGEDGTDEEWLAQFRTFPPPPPDVADPAPEPEPEALGDGQEPGDGDDVSLADLEPAGV